MRRSPSRVLLVVASVLFVVRCGPAATPTTPPPVSVAPYAGRPLATDALLFDSDRTGNFEIFAMRADGTEVRQLSADVRFDSWWPRLAPDRSRVVFYRTPKGVHDTDFTQTSLW